MAAAIGVGIVRALAGGAKIGAKALAGGVARSSKAVGAKNFSSPILNLAKSLRQAKNG